MSSVPHPPPPPYSPHAAPGVDAEMFVAPSDEAVFLLGWMPSLFSSQQERHLLRDALVAPLTQLTFLSFDLQYFLYGVFHTTWLSRAGHVLGFVGVNLSLLAGLSLITAGLPGFDGGAVYAGALLCWYAALSRDARLPLWWVAMVPVVGALYLLGTRWAALGAVAPLSPWLGVLISAAIISLSHAAEPLFPPRAGDPLMWRTLPEFVWGVPGAPNTRRESLRRMARVGLYPFIGLLDELWAAPRLLPYPVLKVMFALGYAPQVRRALDERLQRALASGNPAIDYVGIGGGTPLGPTRLSS